MKKITVILVALLLGAAAAMAQPKAIGLRVMPQPCTVIMVR